MAEPQSSCIFCKIVAGEIPAKIVYSDDRCLAFQDINPQAPVHLLVIPRKHFASTLEATEQDENLIGHVHLIGAKLARDHQITAGYRAVANTGTGAGQTVFHYHLHVLGGRPFTWPPG